MSIGKAIEIVRKMKNINQAELAKQSDITQSYLSLVENNQKKPTLKTLEVIAEKLEVPLPILFLLSLEEDDVPERKKEAYRVILPIMKGLIEESVI